jgi:shikimate dehydrogenase
VNVTIPHKVAVMRYLDEVDEMAAQIGAVNTIVNNDGMLKGYNTDASGFLQALTAEKVKPEGKNVVILGAGGASRSIAFILVDKGANVTILNRHLAAAQVLAGRIMQLFRKDVNTLELNETNLKNALEGADVLVNTTSVGMTPEETVTPVHLQPVKTELYLT